MGSPLGSIAAVAAAQHGSIGLDQLTQLGIDKHRRYRLVGRDALTRAGPRSYVVAGSADTWHRQLWCAWHDLGGRALVAGRSAARLHGLDGFARCSEIELLVPRQLRRRHPVARVVSTTREVGRGESVRVDGLRVASAQRLILDAAAFSFSRDEVERAVDSSVRLRLVSEQRLRTAAVAAHRSGVNGSRLLLDVLVDAGGESRLERMFLAILRRAGIVRPHLQRVFRDGTRVIARVDAFFGADLVVELDGHGSHATRQERQRDAQRRTELLLAGVRVLTFTYDDVRYRPEWGARQPGRGARRACRLTAVDAGRHIHDRH